MRIGLASIRQVTSDARTALERFPLVLASGVLAAAVAMSMIASGDDGLDRFRLLTAATLGLPLFVALEATRERRGWTAGARAGALAAGAAVLLGFYFLSDGWTGIVLATRYVQLSVAFHLLAAILPFAGRPADRAFWQYNRILFLRFLLAGLYSVVLFAGLAIALLALDNLFGIDIDGEAYGHLFVFLAFVFDPWFYLGGVPRDIDALERRTDYPAGLKVFAQFVLIPVVTVYVLILTAYLVRVLVTRTWPSGWIGYLVSSVAAAGTLALLLVHPVRDREDSRWVDAYGRWFYVALLPSIGMLFVAIFQRLGQYGFTERRYFLLVLAFWLAAIALYYAVTASRNIRLIPVTLCIVAFATLAGPWSAYAVSQGSQTRRLEALLEGQGLLVDGQVVPAQSPEAVPPEAQREISAAVRYLVSTHGTASLGALSPRLREVAEAADTIDANYARAGIEITQAVVDDLNLPYVDSRLNRPLDFVNFYVAQEGRSIDLDGFEVLVRMNLASIAERQITIGADTLTLVGRSTQPGPQRLELLRDSTVIASIPLWTLVDMAWERLPARPGPANTAGGPEERPLEITGDVNGLRYRLIAWSVNGRGHGETAELQSADGDLLLARSTGR